MKKHMESFEWDDYSDPDDVLDASYFAHSEDDWDIDMDVEDDEFHEVEYD